MREFFVTSRSRPCQGNEMLTEKFFIFFFLAKKIEKDYDNFFRIALGNFHAYETGARLEIFF
jgi:hypothetical protein